MSSFSSKKHTKKKVMLEASFSLDEVKNAVWSCGNDKAPGLDGFTFKFLKEFWNLLKDDILDI